MEAMARLYLEVSIVIGKALYRWMVYFMENPSMDDN